ncbi:hypothetical protein ED92_39330 [Amycolatopsis sp. MJM2582]|uniref:hypothetical protein n=1 Tax=Amycolatopsis sp. MJM2582 TaxID=1427749 RepID=UPI0005063D5F|nr:hypothetical protein [Amycolatopsis sp. MJM2582]KFZ77129.1 hypothetical protein ED92_39330 [Amycolatopsis sp. MJM2582]
MLDVLLRANGFTHKNDTWTRQNLTAGGLFDLDIVPDDDHYLCTLRQGTTTLLNVRRDADGAMDLVVTLTS